MATSAALAAKCPKELAAAARDVLKQADLRTVELVDVVRACSRMRVDDPKFWKPASDMLAPRLERANARRLADIAHSYAAVKVQCDTVVEPLLARLSSLVKDNDQSLDARSSAIVLAALGRLKLDAEAKLPTGLIQDLEPTLLAGVGEMNAVDISNVLGGLTRLGQKADDFLSAARHRVVELARSDELGHRHITLLATTYARMGHRDAVLVDALARTLLRQARQAKLVPAEYMASLVQAFVVRLKPPPAEFKVVIELSLPSALSHLSISDLVMVVPALAFVPGLRSSSNGLGPAVFGACLAAPLSEFRPRALVGLLRTARAIKFCDIDFWLLALQDVEQSIAAGEQHWDTCDLCGIALIAGRLISDASVKTTPVGAHDVNKSSASLPTVASGEAFSGSVEALLSPAAAKALRAAADTAVLRASELQPRDLGILAVGLARAGMDDGDVFAVIAQRAGQLLEESDETAFDSRDIAQLLAAFAHFQYRDESLLCLLAQRATSSFLSYDKVAQEIVIRAFDELGGIPEDGVFDVLEDALLEYQLARRKDSDRAQPHLLSMEVMPADEYPE